MDDVSPTGPPGPASVAGLPPAGQPSAGSPVPTAQQSAERMQSLLSRAVEDQLSEQRSFATSLEQMRTQLTQLTAELRSTAPVEGLEKLARDVSALDADLRAASEALGARVDALVAQVKETVRPPDTTIPTRLGALAADLAAQGTALDAVADKVGGLGPVPEAVSGLTRDVAGLT